MGIRKEERDYRILERERMFRIFAPLDESEPPQHSDEPRVIIPVEKEDRVEPIRQNGRVVAVRVTPPGGKPYYLIDTSGNGNWMRRDALDTGLAVPMFPILEFE